MWEEVPRVKRQELKKNLRKALIHHLAGWAKSLISFVFTSLIILILFFLPSRSLLAANGGRIGGGNFQSPPSVSRPGSYGGGYGGGYNNSYRSNRIGFPFFLPVFGFGGGGLFSFLILITITGVIVNAIRGFTTYSAENQTNQLATNSSFVSIIQLQIGLLASAKELQEKLRYLAIDSDTKNSLGLQKLLQETTLAIMRFPNLCIYANTESGQVPFSSAETTFNRLSISERSKVSAEITSNVSGEINLNLSETAAGEADETNEFIAITILVASKKNLKVNNNATNEGLRENLEIIGSITPIDLIALEIIWQPEGKGDRLSYEELITSYPNLKYL